MNRFTAVFLFLLWADAGPSDARYSLKARPLPEILGVTHVDGKYHFTDKDFVSEGADEILAIGSRVIKVWFHALPNSYRFNTEWPQIDSLVDMARTPHFQQLFEKPFTTYILMAFAVGQWDGHWLDGFSEQERQFEYQQFYDLTAYLLTRYRGTDKMFVLQHWEGDWMVRGGTDASKDPTPEAMKRMTAWLNARQAGVSDARERFRQVGVRVYHAAEVNLVVQSMDQGRPGVINKVIPNTNVDLVSYSAWDSVIPGGTDPNLFHRALDFIAANTPDHPDFGDKNVYVGEFGVPANQFPPAKRQTMVANTVQASLAWGCPWVVYWQLYCNEFKGRSAPLPVKYNDAMKGFWLIKPDGSKDWAWHYLHGLLKPAQPLPGASGQGAITAD